MILNATREQEQAVRDLLPLGAYKQEVHPPIPGLTPYVKVLTTGPHGSSGWKWVAPDGRVYNHQPMEQA